MPEQCIDFLVDQYTAARDMLDFYVEQGMGEKEAECRAELAGLRAELKKAGAVFNLADIINWKKE